jgi:diguanylate cyclase (GGDEF)-like protein
MANTTETSGLSSPPQESSGPPETGPQSESVPTNVVSHRSMVRLLAIYAAVSLVPIVLLGVVLAWSYRTEARQRGVAEGRSEAVLVARTAVEPQLTGRPLSQGLTSSEHASMQALVDQAVHEHDILRLRLHSLSGQVVYSDDGSGFSQRPEDEVTDAADGEIVAKVSRLNSDPGDTGKVGPESVEVYLPLTAGPRKTRVGVLEIYLPYAPISADVTAGLHVLYRDLILGLAGLYLAIAAISFSVSRRLREQLKVNTYLAEHDALTDLPNRSLFLRRAGEALEGARRSGRPMAIAIVDLDRFKEVNDTLGHHNGDHLLTELSRRLATFMRPKDCVARLGGDEFGIILRDVEDAVDILWRVRAVIEHEVSVSGLPLSVDASIGFVMAPEDGADVDDLLQRADVAMYVAKEQHSGVVRYNTEQNHYDAANLALVGQLRHAIESDQLVLHYQPKAALVSGRIDAVEALVRWHHPEMGLLSPDRFVPLAEQTDLIDKLTEWVLGRALRDLAELSHLGRLGAGPDDDVTMAVNVSARNLGRPGFADMVVESLAAAGVPASRLVIEITETALLTDPEGAAAVLARLSAAGVKMSIDDFGCGQTSLGYLSTLPIHELKIDRSFIADMSENPAHAAIVRSIVDLGHNLSLHVVGEGVESGEIWEMLRHSGCDAAQGFLLARPMPVDLLREWLVGRPVTAAPTTA